MDIKGNDDVIVNSRKQVSDHNTLIAQEEDLGIEIEIDEDEEDETMMMKSALKWCLGRLIYGFVPWHESIDY